jgi:MFS family permease
MQSSVKTTKRGTALSYKWVVAFTVVFGIFMSILDSTIVNIAIPHLQSAFGVSLNAVQWVLTGYTLAQGIATPLTAYLADRLGTKRLYLFALSQSAPVCRSCVHPKCHRLGVGDLYPVWRTVSAATLLANPAWPEGRVVLTASGSDHDGSGCGWWTARR